MAKIGSNEVKIGIMVSISLLLLAVMVMLVGTFHTLQPGYRIHVGFNFASGLAVGAPVYLSGVEVGQVESLEFLRGNESWVKGDSVMVSVVCWVPAWTRIPVNSNITVNTLGLMGEKYVEVIPGDTTTLLKDGAYVRGVDPLSTAQVFDKAYKTLDSINQSFEGIKKVMGDTVVQQEIRETIANAKEASANARQITADFQTMLTENRGNVQAASSNLREASERLNQGVDHVAKNFESFSGRLDRLTAENEKQIGESIDNFHAASVSLKGGVDTLVSDLTSASGGIKTFVAEHQDDMDTIVVNLREASIKINGTLRTVQSIADKADRGEGALGTLLNDEEVSQDIKDTVKNLSASSANINQLLQEIRRQPRRFVRFSIF